MTDALALLVWLVGIVIFGFFALVFVLQAIGCPCWRHAIEASGYLGLEIAFVFGTPRLVWGSGKR